MLLLPSWGHPYACAVLRLALHLSHQTQQLQHVPCPDRLIFFTDAQGPTAAAAAAAEAAQNLGQPVVVRQLTRAVGLASLNGGGPESSVALTQPVTVRIYMSGTANSTGSAGSVDTAVGAGAAGAAAPTGNGAAAAPAAGQQQEKPEGAAKLQARMQALEQMARRVAKAQQTIVKGVPTPLPSSRAAAAEAARQARGAGGGGAGGLTSPTSTQRQQQMLGSSHASGLHRLARGSAVNYSPFHHHKRPHPADSEASSSSAASSGKQA